MKNEQDIADVEEEVVVAGEEIIEEEVVEPELDDAGNPIEPVVVKEAWQLTEDEEADELPDTVNFKSHVGMKNKLKGRISKRDDEIEKLRQEVETLKQGTTTTSTELPPKPIDTDFDSDDLYEEALEDWRDRKADIRSANTEAKRTQGHATKQEQDKIAKDVDSHYDRAAELVTKSGISAEHFKEADESVRQAVETILPKRGDGVTDYIISVLGEGSEKVIYFLGRNKAAKAEFQSLLAEDKTGSKALVYLGQQKERLNNPKRKTSSAPKPAKNAKGDAVISQSGAALKKKYDAATKAGNSQAAYDAKKAARAAKVDVSSW